MYFEVQAPGNKSTRDRSLLRLLNSPGLTIFASGTSTIVLPSDQNELCDKLKLLPQKNLEIFLHS